MGWVCGWFFLQAVGAFASPASSSPSVQITPELRASLRSDYQVDVVVTPHRGDAWTRLAKRVSGDAENWRDIARANQASETLTVEQRIHVPFALLRPELQRRVVGALFPGDGLVGGGWRHIVVGDTGIEGESLWNMAEWFTGNGSNYKEIRRANPSQGLSTRKGDVVLIPEFLLAAAFRNGAPAFSRPGRAGGSASVATADVRAKGETDAPKTAAEIRGPEDDTLQRATTDDDAAETAVEAVAVGPAPSLTFERSAAGPYAVYRLQKGEALYSSVAIRFTGRVYSKDVGDVLARIVKFNDIDDVARIRIGYPVKIPMDLLLPEYLPADAPERVAREQSQRESAKLARHTQALNLSGIQVILDAGHGGRDVGTSHDGVYESSYVYDVMCRLKQLMEKRSAATIFTTTRSQSDGYAVIDEDELSDKTDHVVLTTPRYSLDDPVVGVNLRWYLANSLFRHAMKAKVAKDKVVFISIHADSLHPSLRGAMVYIPGEKFVQGSFEKRDQVYLARAEVREWPRVRHSANESLAAEGFSRNMAESIIDSFEESGLKVHPFNPIRDNVVRDDHEWVPAIIRHNVVPTRVLIEICNLGNARDRQLMKTRRYRQHVAEAIYRGIVAYYDEPGEIAAPAKVARAGK
ncbi:MAG: N-acetylmuramoyl-L-alanine amidase [Acidobacteriota bacterium]